MAVGQPQVLSELTLPVNGTVGGRAPSCGGCSRRESALTSHMHLEKFVAAVDGIGRVQSALLFLIMCFMIYVCVRSLVGTPCYRRYTEVLLTLVYTVLYMIASPVAIMCNKVLMKDYGFGYPVMVSALGQTTTAVCAYLVVRCTGMSVENGRKVSWRNLMLLGAASALALVLGQYPYLYLTVAFIQMLKAFSPAYMVFFLAALQVERPSRRVIACVLGLSVCTAVASAGEVNFNIIGVSFMAAASCSDALRLVVAQKLLRNMKLQPMEMLYFMSPICILWMLPFALIGEVPTAIRRDSFALVYQHPMLFIGAGFSGFFVNITGFLIVKRTSSMTLKLLTMTRNGGLVLASGLFFGETITALEGVGYGGLMVCFGLYTWVKASEAQAAARARELDEASGEASALRKESGTELAGSGAISPSEIETLTDANADSDGERNRRPLR